MGGFLAAIMALGGLLNIGVGPALPQIARVLAGACIGGALGVLAARTACGTASLTATSVDLPGAMQGGDRIPYTRIRSIEPQNARGVIVMWFDESISSETQTFVTFRRELGEEFSAAVDALRSGKVVLKWSPLRRCYRPINNPPRPSHPRTRSG